MKRFFGLISPLNLGRLLLLAVILVSFHQMDGLHPPQKKSWEKRKVQGQEPTLEQYKIQGLWYGAATRAGICGMLLLVSLAWGTRKETVVTMPLTLRSPTDPEVSPKVFALVLGVIVITALAVRLPRMTQSFWGDESDAVAMYVLGSYRMANPDKPEGKLTFRKATWDDTLYNARHGANNHVLFSICARTSLRVWQRINGLPGSAVSEWAIRLPVLLAGLGALVTTALLLRRWGAPVLGLAAVALISAHPWHIRYSTEARGYAFMLLLLPVFLILLTNALERNRWRDWLGLGVLEFLLMYSWPGIMYVLAALNAAAGCLILLNKERVSMLARWVTANLVGAAIFVSLYMPHLPQIESARRRLLWIKGLPMDEVWFHNLLTQPFNGIAYHELVKDNPAEMSWERLYHQHPVLTTVSCSILLLMFFLGLVMLWRRSRPVALLVMSVFGAAVVCTLHFKFILQDELRAWYLIFTVPFVCICVALGWMTVASFMNAKVVRGRVSPVCSHAAIVVVFLALFTTSVWPMNANLVTQAEEDYKGALAVTRGRHEAFSESGPSGVYTIWLWRYSAVYDPRGEYHTRDLPALQKWIDKARKSGRELYVIIGFRQLALQKNADMLSAVEDPTQFEMVAAFPSRESIHTLDVYRMKTAATAH